MTFKLHCMANQLASVLDAANTVTDHGVKVPILKAIRIEVSNGQGEFISTNTDQTVRSVIAADGEGVIHLDTAALATKVKALRPNAPVSIEGDASAVHIVQGRTRWKLPALVNTGFDFQAAASRIDGVEMPISFDALSSALRAAQPAFLVSQTHYHLQGASLEWVGGKMCVVGTDTHMLHAIQIAGQWPVRDGILLPPEGVAALSRLYAPGTDLKMIVGTTSVSLDDGETLFRSKMIDGKFPDWRRIVPKPAGSVSVDAAAFIEALARVSAIREDEGKTSRFVQVRMVIGDSEITMTTKNRDGEEGADYCECQRMDGEGEYGLTVSASMLLTSLRSMGQVDTLRLEFGDQRPHDEDRPPPIVVHRLASDVEDFRLVTALRA